MEQNRFKPELGQTAQEMGLSTISQTQRVLLALLVMMMCHERTTGRNRHFEIATRPHIDLSVK